MLWIILLLLSFGVTYSLLRIWINYARSRGILAPDAHKPGEPLVANRGGIVFIIPALLYLIVPLFYETHGVVDTWREALAIVLSVATVYLVGFADDLKNLGLLKVPLTVLGGIHFILLRAYWHKPVVPFIGPVRLTLIYPLLILCAFLIVPNASNMVDVHNGTLATSVLAVLSPLLLWSLILGDYVAASYVAIALGITLGFFAHNKYPAKVFAGNVGSYSLGALLAAVIIVSRLEYIAVIAWLPVIMLGFYLLSSIGGLATREKIVASKGKAVIVKDGKLYPSLKPSAPISLSRILLLQKGPMTERELVREYYKLFGFSAILGALTGLFMFNF